MQRCGWMRMLLRGGTGGRRRSGRWGSTGWVLAVVVSRVSLLSLLVYLDWVIGARSWPAFWGGQVVQVHESQQLANSAGPTANSSQIKLAAPSADTRYTFSCPLPCVPGTSLTVSSAKQADTPQPTYTDIYAMSVPPSSVPWPPVMTMRAASLTETRRSCRACVWAS